MIGTEVFHKKFRHSVFFAPLCLLAENFRGGKDEGFSENCFRKSAILRSPLSAREIFSRGMIGTEIFHRIFSQLSHFITPLSVREKYLEGEDTGGDFFTIFFRNSVILALHLSARETFLRKFQTTT